MSKHHDNTIPPPLTNEQLSRIVHDVGKQLLSGLPRHFHLILTIVEKHPSITHASTTTSLSPGNTATVLRSYLEELTAYARSGKDVRRE